ncbi:MAG: LolA family protein [Pyrinomonadaceae bacterium]
MTMRDLLKNIAAVFVLLFTLSPAAPAQSLRARAASGAKVKEPVDEVEQLLDRYMLAQGGVALFKVKTRTVRGRIEMSDSPLTGTFEMYSKAPAKVMMVANTPLGQIIEVSNGGQRWMQTPWGEMKTASGAGEEMLARAASGKGGFRWRNAFSAASLKGTAVIDGRKMIVLDATISGRARMLWYFDAETFLLRKLEFPAQAGAQETERLCAVYYDSYATVDGVKVAALFRQVYTNFTLTFRVTDVKHDVLIEDALFETPNGK